MHMGAEGPGSCHCEATLDYLLITMMTRRGDLGLKKNVNSYLQKGQEGSRKLLFMPGLNPQENLGETKCLCIHGGQKGSWSFSAWIHNGEMRLDEAKGRLQRAFFF